MMILSFLFLLWGVAVGLRGGGGGDSSSSNSGRRTTPIVVVQAFTATTTTSTSIRSTTTAPKKRSLHHLLPPPREGNIEDTRRGPRRRASFPPPPPPPLLPSSSSSSSSSSFSTTTGGITTRLFYNTKSSINSVQANNNYGEESRAYRRTIYTFDDWKKHRDPSRFFKRALTIFRSGIYWNIRLPVQFTTLISTFVVIWNCTFTKFQLSLPLQPFTLSSASLGLLLVFRTNTGYGRWDEARKCWGMNINRTRDLMRMAVGWYDESYMNKEQQQQQQQQQKEEQSSSTTKRHEDLTALALATWSFVRCMKRHLSPDDDDEVNFRNEMLDKLPRQQAMAIIDADHRPNRALFDLSVAIENLPMHFLRKNQMHLSLTKFEDNLGSSERLLSSPVPLFYSRHLQRFLLCWLSFLPFALYEVFCGSKHLWINRFVLIPVTALISTFMFGIDELANQMEEPFTILPQQQFCDRIFKWCMEMVDWKPGDNGTRLNHYGQTTAQQQQQQQPPPGAATTTSTSRPDRPFLEGDADFAP